MVKLILCKDNYDKSDVYTSNSERKKIPDLHHGGPNLSWFPSDFQNPESRVVYSQTGEPTQE